MQYRLTKKQRLVLDTLTETPQYLKGPALVAANALCLMGFAERVGNGVMVGGYYRLTALGAIQRGPIAWEQTGLGDTETGCDRALPNILRELYSRDVWLEINRRDDP